MLLSFLYLFIILVIFFAPGFFITPLLFEFNKIKSPVATYFFYSFLLPLISTPLLVFFANHFFGYQVNKNLILIILISLFLISFFVFFLNTKTIIKGNLSRIKITITDNLYFWLIVAVFFAVTFSINFIGSPPLPGPDSPSYLYQSAKIVRELVYPTEGFDRHILQNIPVIFSISNTLSLETLTKLLSITLYFLGGLVVYLITTNLTENQKIGLFAMSAAYLNYSLARLSLDIYATLMATIVIYSVLNLLIVKKISLHSQYLLSSFLVGSTFNMHGIISFSTAVFLLPPLIYQLKTNSKKITIFIISLSIIIFLFVSQPLILKSLSYLYQGVYKPVVVSRIKTSSELTHPNEGLENFARVRQLPTLFDFPQNKNLFKESYGIFWLIFSILGFITLLSHKVLSRKIDDFKKHTLLLFTGGGLILTQQSYFGVDWFSGRFVYTLYPLIVIFGSLFFWAFLIQIEKIKSQTFKKIIAIVITLVFLLPTNIRAIDFLTTEFKSPVDKAEYNLYKRIDSYFTDKELSIFYLGYEKEWLVGLNPHLNPIIIDPKLLCTDYGFGQLSSQEWLISDAFCVETSLSDSLIILSEFGGKEYYVLLQSSIRNTQLDFFLNSHYDLIHQEDTIYLFKRKDES